MSSFLETKPVRGVPFLAYAVAIALLSFLLNFGMNAFMTKSVAVHESSEKIEIEYGKAVAKFKAAQKKAAKDAKAGAVAPAASPEEAFAADPKARQAFEATAEEIRHHAVAGTWPMVVFIAIVSGLCTGLMGALLVVRRTKDSCGCPWITFFSQIPVFATYMLVAFLPFMLGISAHDEGGVVALIKSDMFLAIGVVIALAGVAVKLVLTALPSRPQEDCHDCHCAH